MTISFEDGESISSDAVVAADGINSIFRRKVSAGFHSKVCRLSVDSVSCSSHHYTARQERHAGTCWRAVISDHEIVIDDLVATETWGPSGRFGIVPLAGGKIYWFACVKAKARDSRIAKYSIPDLHSIFRDFHRRIPQIIQTTDHESLIHNDILDIKPIQQYAFGRIVLLGDAAHATTPNLGQGAGQTMEDAYVLARCLDAAGDPVMAFKEYERKRLGRTRKIIKMSNQIGRIAQLENKGLILLRNFVLSKSLLQRA